MSSFVEGVAKAVVETSVSVESVVELARALDDLAATMSNDVRTFTDELRAA
jgi:hypothetical protein